MKTKAAKLLPIPKYLKEFKHNDYSVFCILETDSKLMFKFVDDSHRKNPIDIEYTREGFIGRCFDEHYYKDMLWSLKYNLDLEDYADENK